jgi:hypothetical protein
MAEIVARQAQGSVAVQAFRECEGIKAASLYGWRSRLREDTQERCVSRNPAKTERG